MARLRQQARSSRGKANPPRRRRSRASSSFKQPGTPIFIGDQRLENAILDIIVYSSESSRETRGVPLQECLPSLDLAHDGASITWVNVNGIHDVGLIEALGEHFALHPMTIEDIVNTAQRPKWDVFSNYGMLVLKMLDMDASKENVRIEHVSLILGSSWVISFLEDEGDVFESVRQAIGTNAGRIRRMGADYLLFCLVDAVVDHYFLVVEHIGDKVEILDDRLLEDPRQDDIRVLHRFKRDLLLLRRAVWPLREVLSAVSKEESPLLHSETKVFWRDLYDHCIQVIDIVETARDTLSSMHDTYLSSISNRMNEVMKVLTIFSTIFMPITFIAGVYGMNFQYMPELAWKPAYFITLAVMALIAISMALYFRHRRWI
jgi:magnesium transporter